VILEKIVNSTRKSVSERKAQMALADLEKVIEHQPPPRNFARALRGNDIKLIAEIKRASPSKGLLCQNLDVGSVARIYEQNGAAAVSVLTESEFFGGSFADLDTVRKEVALPLVCKDFILDSYQIYQARASGADAVLLIVAVLTHRELKTLMDTAESLGMEALVEVHSKSELERALELRPRIIGINNRNLNDFGVNLETTLKLKPYVPANAIVVSESGIHTRGDVLRLQQSGINAILVGEALVTSIDPAAKIDELLGKSRSFSEKHG
jgi:indole-3-glycerol phosphate synthase